MSVNHIFKHYKGNYYKILHIGVHTETKESMVVYKRHNGSDHTIWIRPYDMFFENVIVDMIEVPRFIKCPSVFE